MTLEVEAPWITLSDVWHAYRKAKKAAYYDSNCGYGLRFAKFEDNLVANLQAIYIRLLDRKHIWARDTQYLGRSAMVPKAVDPTKSEDGATHFCDSDPWEDWKLRHPADKKAQASVRTVLDGSVEYMVIATVWVLKVGAKFDAKMDNHHVFANRVHRRWIDPKEAPGDEAGEVNWDSHWLYRSYLRQYSKWRETGIRTTRRDLENGQTVVAVALDVESFFDRVDPAFLLNNSFLIQMGVVLSQEERDFTKGLITSMQTWRTEHANDPAAGLPIGLPSSGLIANLVLAPFDLQVVEHLRPSFYGRYVDDIYLSLLVNQKFADGEGVLKWLAREVPFLRYRNKRLEVLLPFAKKTVIRFGDRKQRIFRLAGASGLDVIQPIEEHMRKQSSEHRLLPTIPESPGALAEKALLVSKDASLRTAVMREADMVTLQRAGFAEQLGIHEKIARLVPASGWRDKRRDFYGLVERHVLAPKGFFDLYIYIPRIVGLMAECQDWDDLASSLRRMRDLKNLISETCDLPAPNVRKVFENLARRVELACLKAIGQLPDEGLADAVRAIRRVRGFGEMEMKRPTPANLREHANKLLRTDWSRKPFYEHFLEAGGSGSPSMPRLPQEGYAKMRVGDIQECLKLMGLVGRLDESSWRAFLFPIRPCPLHEITERIGWRNCVLQSDAKKIPARRQSWRLYNFALAIRGIRLPPWLRPKPYFREGSQHPAGILVGTKLRRPIRVGIANFLTTEEEWKFCARHTPVMNAERLSRLTVFLNDVLRHSPKPDYIVMPELSLPRRLAGDLQYWLAKEGVSLIAGLEYGFDPLDPTLRKNEALVSLALSRGAGSLSFLQSKNFPAWAEAVGLEQKAAARLKVPKSPVLPIYIFNGMAFGVLICSDLTNPKFRQRFQGQVDTLFVLEWNQDVNSFASLIEATALDVHAFVVQANNRLYGDSRIRAPFKKEFLRDVVQLKGGVHDYFVVGEVDPIPLRDFQTDAAPYLGEDALFKPFPVGFQISAYRRKKAP